MLGQGPLLLPSTWTRSQVPAEKPKRHSFGAVGPTPAQDLAFDTQRSVCNTCNYPISSGITVTDSQVVPACNIAAKGCIVIEDYRLGMLRRLAHVGLGNQAKTTRQATGSCKTNFFGAPFENNSADIEPPVFNPVIGGYVLESPTCPS